MIALLIFRLSFYWILYAFKPFKKVPFVKYYSFRKEPCTKRCFHTCNIHSIKYQWSCLLLPDRKVISPSQEFFLHSIVNRCRSHCALGLHIAGAFWQVKHPELNHTSVSPQFLSFLPLHQFPLLFVLLRFHLLAGYMTSEQVFVISIVISNVLAPIIAAVNAASHPACPTPNYNYIIFRNPYPLIYTFGLTRNLPSFSFHPCRIHLNHQIQPDAKLHESVPLNNSFSKLTL